MIDEGLLSGLPNGVRALLASPPRTDPRLLELAARWEGLPPAQARMADALRLFVVTWDPLEWLAPRPEAVATANAWPLELVSAIITAAAHEDAVMSGRYAELVAHRKVPDLLSGEPGPAPSEVAIGAVSPGWEDIGLGAITDFVQQAFGPVDFDRSLVELTATGIPLPGCPACAGRRFKFPADLADSRDRMCQAHHKEADTVIQQRMARAEASNPAGWRMTTDASARLSLPHLPGGAPMATSLGAGPGSPDSRSGTFRCATSSAYRPDITASSWAAAVMIAEHVERWPGDVQTRMLAGDALALLGDGEAALAQYQAALPLAQQAKDHQASRELSVKVFRLTHSGSAHPPVQRRQPRSKPGRSQRKGKR